MIWRMMWILFCLVFVTLAACIDVIAIGLVYRQTSYLYKFARVWVKLILKAMALDLEIKGQNNIDQKKKYSFMVNHESLLDILMVVRAIKNPITIVGKQNIFHIPIFGLAIKIFGIVQVQRHKKSSAKAVYEKIPNILMKKDISMLLFPQRSRRRGNKLLPFLTGSFVLAQAVKYPIVPVAIAGAYDVLRPGKLEWRPGKLKLYILPPIEIGEKTPKELCELTKNAIVEKLEENNEKVEFLPIKKK